MGLVDHIISTALCIPYLEAILLATPESVPHKAVLTDGENGETDQKVNKYLQKTFTALIKSRALPLSNMPSEFYK